MMQPARARATVPFPLLRNPESYEPATFPYSGCDLKMDPGKFPTLRMWIEVFRRSLRSFR